MRRHEPAGTALLRRVWVTLAVAQTPEAARAGRRAPARLGAVRRSRRLHVALRGARRRGRARAAVPLLRHLPAADRAVRRDGREVHRRRRDGRLGHADGDRGRRRARSPRSARPRRRGVGARRRGRRTGAAGAGGRADGRGGGHARRRGRRGWSPATSSTPPRGSRRSPSRGTVFVGEATRRATEQTVVYEDAGAHELKGKVGLTPLWRALRVVSGARGSLKSQGLEAPFVGRDRELRQIKDLFHACADEGKAQLVSVTGIAGIGKSRLALGVLQVLRRDRPDHVLAPRPLPLLRRGRHLLGARRHGADARPDRRGRGVRLGARQAARRRRGARPRSRSAASSSRGSRICSASRRAAATSARTCSRPGGSSSSGSPDVYPAVMRLRGHAVGGRVAARLHRVPARVVAQLADLRRHAGAARAARAAADLGRRAPQLHARSTSSRSPTQAMEELLAGLVPGLPDGAARRRSSRAPRASRSTRSRPCGCCSTAARSSRRAPSTGRPARSSRSRCPETLHALIAARLDGLPPAERRVVQDAAVLGKTFTKQALAALVRAAARPSSSRCSPSLARKEVLRRPGRPALARARPVRLPPGSAAQGRLRDAGQGGPEDAAPCRRRVPRAARSAEQEVVEVVASHYLAAYEAAPDADDAAAIRAKAGDQLARAGERAASLGANEEARAVLRAGGRARGRLADEGGARRAGGPDGVARRARRRGARATSTRAPRCSRPRG